MGLMLAILLVVFIARLDGPRTPIIYVGDLEQLREMLFQPTTVVASPVNLS